MSKWAFLGGFLAVALVLTVVILVIRAKIREASRKLFGTADLLDHLSDLDMAGEDAPRSLSGADRLITPDILKDFPDFDVPEAKRRAEDYLRDRLADKEDLQIHNIVMSRYLRSQAQKTILFQAAAGFSENGQKYQKRYNLDYVYSIAGGDTSVAANCPNCGANLGYGVTACPYCGSRVVNVMGNTWKFAKIQES